MFFKARNYGVLACCLIALYVVLNLSKRLRSLSQLNILYMYFFLQYCDWPVQKITLSLLGWARPENSIILAGLGPSRKFRYPCWAGPAQKIPLFLLGCARTEKFRCHGWARLKKLPYPCNTGPVQKYLILPGLGTAGKISLSLPENSFILVGLSQPENSVILAGLGKLVSCYRTEKI